MPNKILLPYPPGLGAEDRELQSYLYKLVEQLNVCLESVDVEQISGAMKGTLEKITGLGNDINKVGSSASEALVAAIKQVKTDSDTMDREIRVSMKDMETTLRNLIEGDTAVLERLIDRRVEEVSHETKKLENRITELEKEVKDLRTELRAHIEETTVPEQEVHMLSEFSLEEPDTGGYE